MTESTITNRWLVPCGGRESSFEVRGWHPVPFDWELTTLHARQAQLRKLKIVFARRPGDFSGSQPEVLFDQLPVPLFPADGYVIEKFTPFWDGFAPVSVQSFYSSSDQCAEKWGRTLVLVPLPEVMYDDPADVPPHRHMAVIAHRFCVSTELLKLAEFYFRYVVFTTFSESAVTPTPSTPDFSEAFRKREPSQEPVVEETIFQFVVDSLQCYQVQVHTPISGMLLDCDPQYGYVILALKQSPISDLSKVEIDDFELDQFSILEAEELYGELKYLSATRMRAVLKRVIEKLAQYDVVRSLKGISTLQIAYAFHDEEIHWLAKI